MLNPFIHFPDIFAPVKISVAKSSNSTHIRAFLYPVFSQDAFEIFLPLPVHPFGRQPFLYFMSLLSQPLRIFPVR